MAEDLMPQISRFYGIIIAMYYDDHAPPHFHVRYGGKEVSIRIETLDVHEGGVPARALALTLEWAALHRAELRENWERARRALPLKKIAPLR